MFLKRSVAASDDLRGLPNRQIYCPDLIGDQGR
jgi:hypothetical protein